jgi:hypothetical protein
MQKKAVWVCVVWKARCGGVQGEERPNATNGRRDAWAYSGGPSAPPHPTSALHVQLVSLDTT